MKKISIIVPVYNESEGLKNFFSNLFSSLQTIRQQYDCEVIVVDDGSIDGSAAIIRALAEEHPTLLRTIIFSRNFGKEVALTAGIQHCQGDACILIDSDFQHPVELLPDFLRAWENGARLVVGVRENQHHVGIMRRFSTYIFYKILRTISPTPITPYATDFRLLDRSIINEFCRLTERTRLTRGLIDWLGFEPTIIYFTPNKRAQGKPGYGFIRLIQLAFSSIVSLSLFPLKFAGYLGGVIMIISACLGTFVFIDKYILLDRWGFHFTSASLLVLLILFVTGLILACLGLMSLYIATIYEEVINRPMYIIKESRNLSQSHKER